MIAGEIDPGLGYQSSQPRNEIHRVECYLCCPMPKAFAALMGQAFPVRRLQGIDDLAGRTEG